MKNYSIFKLVLILTPFVFSFALGLDIYIPITPQMVKIFDTTPAMIQMTLSLFLFITGAGQLIIGPMADHFGRKFAFYLSATCYAIGSIACAFSGHIAWLIIARAISAIGACGMLVTAFAIVRDLFTSDQSAKIYSLLNGAIGISPTFAPILGGYLALYFGWQSIFVFLTCIGFISFVVCRFYIEETIKDEDRVKIDKDVFKRYFGLLKNAQFMKYSLMGGLSEAVFFSFFSISPFIIIQNLGVPTHEFGYYFAAFGLVIVLGGIASGKIIEKVGVRNTMAIGIGLMFLGGLSMLSWYLLEDLSLQSFLIPMVIACMGAMFLGGGSASGALDPFGEIAGTAAAGFGAIQFSISTIVGTALMLFPTSTTVPYGICIMLLAVSCVILFIQTQSKAVLVK
ncbi:MAG: multidrug effflux MFS transporter [Chlamydiales bacterium]|nr:multidrug effflux MFS transporter [Chlamydiales bacterium]